MENDPIAQRINAEKIITSAAKSLAGKLNKEIEKGNDNTAFFIAMLLASFKDFVDIILTFTGVGLIPGVEFVVGLFLTSFLFFFMLGKGWFLKWRIKAWFWVLGLFFDGLPAFSALPINVLLVLYAWRLAKKRKEHAEIKLENLENLTEAEIHRLNNDISILEKEQLPPITEANPRVIEHLNSLSTLKPHLYDIKNNLKVAGATKIVDSFQKLDDVVNPLPRTKRGFTILGPGEKFKTENWEGEEMDYEIPGHERVITGGRNTSLHLQDTNDHFYVDRIHVDEGERGQGIATDMYDEALKLAEKEGKKGVISHSRRRNADGNRMWEKFRREGRVEEIEIAGDKYEKLKPRQSK